MAPITKVTKKTNEAAKKLLAAKPDEEFIPYVCHYDPYTIITKNGELLQTIRITGFGTNSVATDLISLRDTLRDSINAHIKDTEFAFWFHTFRRKKNVIPEGEFPDYFSKKINEAWDKENNWSQRYLNELYITIIIEGLDSSITDIKTFLRSFSYSATRLLHQKYLQESHAKLSKVVTNILVDIEEYGAELLGIEEWDGVLYSAPMRFFGKITNLYEEHYPLWISDIAEELTSHKFAFGERMLEVIGYDNKNFAAMLSLKEYQEASVEALDRVLQLPFEFIISQSFDFNFDKKDLDQYEYQDYLFKVSGDEEARYLSGISNFIDSNSGSATDYGKLQTTIMIISKNKEELEKDVKVAMEKLTSLGLLVIREDIFSEHCFWSQLPGNFSYLRRQKLINSRQVAGFAALHNFPSGAIEDNHWGSAVTVLRTVLDTPYFFNFHEKDLGHTFIFGPKFSGKTVLVNFLLAQSRKFKNKIFYFDLNQSSKAFIKALDGEYYDLAFDSQSAEFLSLNPLLLTKNEDNKKFLNNWFRSLVAFTKEHVAPEQINLISKIIDDIFASDVKNLTAAAEFFNNDKTKDIYEKLKIWSSGKLSIIFNAESEINWSDKIIAFDYTSLVNQKPILIPTIIYLLHKIEENLDGSPAIIVMDEAWNLIDNPIFAPQIAEFFARMRQKNCVVILKSSDENSVNASDLIFEVKRAVAGEIFTANSQAGNFYQSVLELSEDEMEIIRIMEDDERHFIFKNRGNSIIASLNLKNLKEILKVLSADQVTLTAAEEVLAVNKSGAGEVVKAEIWLPQLFEVLQEIEKDQEETQRKLAIDAIQAEMRRQKELELS